MQTITFYSYKGGVGRTLLLANMARHLSSFQQRVFVLDFDLEAPGLHYKLKSKGDTAAPVRLGLVDYVYYYTQNGKPPPSLTEFVVEVPSDHATGMPIHMLAAGDVPTPGYWARLSSINWNHILYDSHATGVEFFLDLKARIEEEYRPDFLLIDSRTGITEVGGIATTLLADAVVCLLLRNMENQEGARTVLRSIKRASRVRRNAPVVIVPVLTRLPTSENSSEEARIIDSVRAFLNESAPDLSDSLAVEDLPVLHIDRDVEAQEMVLVHGHKTVDDSALLRDYLRLFAQLIPRAVVEPHINRLIQGALSGLLEDPDSAERTLVSVAHQYAHPSTYRTLILFYRLRNVAREKLLDAGRRYWELSNQADDPLLWQILVENQDLLSPRLRFTGFLDFMEAVWRTAGACNVEYGTALLRATMTVEARRHAISGIAKTLAEQPELNDQAVVQCIRAFTSVADWAAAQSLVDAYGGALESNSIFVEAWADCIVQSRDREHAIVLLSRLDRVAARRMLASSPETARRLYLLAGNLSQLRELIEGWEFSTRELRHESVVLELRDLYESLGMLDRFETLVSRGDPAVAEWLSKEVRRSERSNVRRIRV